MQGCFLFRSTIYLENQLFQVALPGMQLSHCFRLILDHVFSLCCILLKPQPLAKTASTLKYLGLPAFEILSPMQPLFFRRFSVAVPLYNAASFSNTFILVHDVLVPTEAPSTEALPKHTNQV